MRNDIYCLYRGKEYRFVHKADGTYEVVTKNKSEIDETFTLYKNEIYRKQVKLDEITDVYAIHSFAVYNGEIFAAIHSMENNVELFTTNIELAQENKMEQIGKSEFVKVVALSEVEVFEEKESLNINDPIN